MIKLLRKLLSAFAAPIKPERPSEPALAPDGLSDVKRELAILADRVSILESEPREIPSGATLRSGMNLNKRTQALRQYRLGRATSEIARNLEMPKAEIDLLVKVHRIVSEQRR